MWRVPPYDRAITELEAYVRATWQPLGAIVSGSIVRGEAGPTSDFDVFIVHAEPWRLREQRRFAGVPAELFVNPATKVRGYFESEHADGRPCTAHMFATGEVLIPHPVIDELVAEAKTWLARPVSATEVALAAQRYGAVDLIDDARDVVTDDPTAAALLLAEAVEAIVAHAFWRRGQRQPRRKTAVTALAAIDPRAAELVRAWAAGGGLATVEELARHVLGVETFFEWTSAREAVVLGGMTDELARRRADVVREHMDSENRHDHDATIATFSHPRYELVGTGDVYDGEAAVRAYFAETRTAFPDQHNRLIALHAGDDAVVAEFEIHGTHTGPLRGFPPTGRAFTVQMSATFVFAPGSDRITCERVYFDSATILRQLGLASDPRTLRGRVETAATHPMTVARALIRNVIKPR